MKKVDEKKNINKNNSFRKYERRYDLSESNFFSIQLNARILGDVFWANCVSIYIRAPCRIVFDLVLFIRKQKPSQT